MFEGFLMRLVNRSPQTARTLRVLSCLIGFALALGSRDTAEAAASSQYAGETSVSIDHWQRIQLDPTQRLRNASQVTIVIQTKGPSMQGLVRIWAALPSHAKIRPFGGTTTKAGRLRATAIGTIPTITPGMWP